MNTHTEELYLEAEQAIKNNDFITAKRNYEEMLQEEPTNACAHNSLGWLYKTQFDEYVKAENHYNAAIKYEPNYPHSYWNLAYLYTDLERWDDLRKLMNGCLSVSSVDKSSIHNRLAIMEELIGNFEVAKEHYESAIYLCVNNDKIEEYKKDIERCSFKLELKSKSSSLDSQKY